MKYIILSFFFFTTLISYSFPKPFNYQDAYHKGIGSKDFQEKIFYLEEFLKSCPPHENQLIKTARNHLPFAYYSLGKKYFDLFSKDTSDKKSFELAKDTFIHGIYANPTKDYNFHWLSFLLKKKNNNRLAISTFAEIYKQLPQVALASFYVGDFYKLEKNWNTALDYYLKSLELKKTSNSYQAIGDIYLKVDQLKKAEKSFQNAIELDLTLLKQTNKNEHKTLKRNLFNSYIHLSKLARITFQLDEILKFNQLALSIQPDSDNYQLWNNQFYAFTYKALTAFGKNDYQKALLFYNNASISRDKNRKLKINTELDEGRNYYLNLIKERKSLGKISPIITHKILAIEISKTDINWDDTYISGKKISIQNELSDTMKKIAYIHEKALSKEIETFSKGQMTLKFDHIKCPFPITTLFGWYFNHKPHLSPVIEKSLIAMGDKFHQRALKNYDSILIYWPGKSISFTSVGGASVFPFRLKAYRGRAVIPMDYLPHTWHTALLRHELFHIFEVLAKISPTHGASKKTRHNFPLWKGKGEIDYIRWHFENQIARFGFANMSFLKSYPELKLKQNSPTTEPASYLYGYSEKEIKSMTQKTNTRFQSQSLAEYKINNDTNLQFISISDLHFHKGKNPLMPFLKPLLSHQDSFIMVNGDTTTDGDIKDVTAYINAMKTLGLPFYSILGNHDVWTKKGWKNYAQKTISGCFILKSKLVKIIALDNASGVLGNKQFSWLEQQLKNQSSKYTLIFMHIPIFHKKSFGVPSINQLEKDKLRKLFEKYNVSLVVAGHAHEYYETIFNNIRYLNLDAFFSNKDSFIRFEINQKGLAYKKIPVYIK